MVYQRAVSLFLCRKYRSDISGITTKAPCEAALMGERHVRIEISDFVMRTFVLIPGISLRFCPHPRLDFAKRKSVNPFGLTLSLYNFYFLRRFAAAFCAFATSCL